MNWLDKLEKKLGRFAIPNLTVYLLAGYVIGFAIYYLAPGLLGWLTLEPAYILRGQVWRIISWVLIPPTGSLISLLFLVLCIHFFRNTFYSDRSIHTVWCVLSYLWN